MKLARSRTNRILISSSGFPKITTTMLDNGVVGDTYSELVSASGAPIIAMSASSGTLPDGIESTDLGSGLLELDGGSPTTSGRSIFTVEAKNDLGSDAKEFMIDVIPAQPSLVSPVESAIVTEMMPDLTFTASGQSGNTVEIEVREILTGTPTEVNASSPYSVPSPLPKYTQINWRTREVDPIVGSGAWSARRRKEREREQFSVNPLSLYAIAWWELGETSDGATTGHKSR